ncbi:MAG: PAS domain-containing sensor histidine kinase [Myxococcota bacterium]|nr:PAS domain-containing sensor histidine kinase [Myxococcota bacterium]
MNEGHLEISVAELREMRTLVNQLLGPHAQEDDAIGVEGGENSVGRVLGDLRKLLEVKVLRQLPAVRFQELLASAVAEQWYDSVIHAINEMLIVIGRSGLIQTINPAAASMLGYAEAEAIGLDFREILVSEGDEAGKGLTCEQLLTEEDLQGGNEIETAYRTREGRLIPVSFSSAKILDDEQNLRAVVCVARDLTERKQVEELRNKFIERVISAEDAERRRIARELHDETSQSLTSLLVRLKAHEATIDSPVERERVVDLRALTSRTLEELGRLARGLHPSVLDDLGFSTAMERYGDEYSKSHNIDVDVHIRGLGAQNRLPLVLETTLYRILQEALTNVARHAGASTVSIIVERQDHEVRAIIEDDGCGFDMSQGQRGLDLGGGLGLHGMRERAALLKGKVQLESTPGIGTTLFVHSPLTEALATLAPRVAPELNA